MEASNNEFPKDPFFSFEKPRAVDYYTTPETKRYVRRLMVNEVINEEILMKEGASYEIILWREDSSIKERMLEMVDKNWLLASAALKKEEEIIIDINKQKEEKKTDSELDTFAEIFKNQETLSYIEWLIEMWARDREFLINEWRAFEKILWVKDEKKREKMISAVINEGFFASYILKQYWLR